jgi:hypothetical protein
MSRPGQSNSIPPATGVYRDKSKVTLPFQQPRLTQLNFLKQHGTTPVLQKSPSNALSNAKARSQTSSLQLALQTETKAKKAHLNSSRNWERTTAMATMNLAQKGASTVMVAPKATSVKRTATVFPMAQRQIKRPNTTTTTAATSSNSSSSDSKPLFNDPDDAFKDAYGSRPAKAPRSLPFANNGTKTDKVEFSAEQTEILDRVEGYGESVFFTGSAG